MANASTSSVVRMHQTHLKFRVHSLLDVNYQTQTHSLAVRATLAFTTVQPTDTVTCTVLLSNDAMGTKAGPPASLVPTVWQGCSTGSLAKRPGLGVRGMSSREETRNTVTVFLVTPPGLAPGIVGPSTVSLPPNKLKGKKTISLTFTVSLHPPHTALYK
jgi:hypothetical protein